MFSIFYKYLKYTLFLDVCTMETPPLYCKQIRYDKQSLLSMFDEGGGGRWTTVNKRIRFGLRRDTGINYWSSAEQENKFESHGQSP